MKKLYDNIYYCTDTCTIKALTVPKQIDRGTACLLGRGLEVLCGVRLIIIFHLGIFLLLILLFLILFTIPSYLCYNYNFISFYYTVF